jgi:hypothetical protein
LIEHRHLTCVALAALLAWGQQAPGQSSGGGFTPGGSTGSAPSGKPVTQLTKQPVESLASLGIQDEYGDFPIAAEIPMVPRDLHPLVDDPARVYLRIGSPSGAHFYYKGNTGT